MSTDRSGARDRAWAITEEMAARAQDPRCPRPFALLLVAWVNALNAEIPKIDTEAYSRALGNAVAMQGADRGE